MALDEANKDLILYLQCMDRIRLHLHIIHSIDSGKFGTADHDLNQELVFLHFRKSLEEIAFSSICSNREKYSAVRAKFGSFWRAKDLLEEIGDLNPDFYPKSIRLAKTITENNTQLSHFKASQEDCLTRDEFVLLYDKASIMLHAQNPYREIAKVVDEKHTVSGWLGKIWNLLTVHSILLIDSEEMWTIFVPMQGQITAGVSKLLLGQNQLPYLGLIAKGFEQP